MTPGQRKAYILVGIAAVLVIGPLALLSSWGMAGLESIAVGNAPERWAATLEIKCADIYRVSLRPKEARAAYEIFYKTFTADPRRGYAKYMVAVCMELDNNESKPVTAAAYEDFLEEFAEDALFQTLPEWRFYVSEADRAIDRLKIN